jgi:hypothetical protein
MLLQRWQRDEDMLRIMFNLCMIMPLTELKRFGNGFAGRADALAPPPPAPAARKKIYKVRKRQIDTSTNGDLVHGWGCLQLFVGVPA